MCLSVWLSVCMSLFVSVLSLGVCVSLSVCVTFSVCVYGCVTEAIFVTPLRNRKRKGKG